MKEKQQLLALLQNSEEPASLKELLSHSPAPIAPRSARRYLKQLIEEGAIEAVGKGRATKYQAKIDLSSPFSAANQVVIDRARQPIYKRKPVSYRRDWLEQYRPNQTFYLPEGVRKELHQAGLRAQEQDPAGTYARQIFNRLLIDLSYNSSRLEGNTYSLLETKKLVLEGSSAEGKLDEEKVMILNHKEAIRFLVDNAHRLEPSAESVRTLHYLLSDGLVEPHEAGSIRRHPVRIGGSSYVPIENPELLEEIFNQICTTACQIEDPFEQSFFLLAHLSYLQAFTDVNKRCARLAANLPLIRHNLVPLSFNGIETPDYISAIITIYEEQEVSPLIDVCAYSYLRTCIEYETTVEALGFDAVRVRYRTQRRAVIREIVLQLLKGADADTFITRQASALVPPADQRAFIEDIHEDLHELAPHRIAGLGITPAELVRWQNSSP